jgi:hypothetical protein
MAPTTEFHCKQCRALLAKHDRDGMCIRRGDLQAVISGADFSVAVTCYRCRTLNLVASAARPVCVPSAPARL